MGAGRSMLRGSGGIGSLLFRFEAQISVRRDIGGNSSYDYTHTELHCQK